VATGVGGVGLFSSWHRGFSGPIGLACYIGERAASYLVARLALPAQLASSGR